jgi:hypothetical protein
MKKILITKTTPQVKSSIALHATLLPGTAGSRKMLPLLRLGENSSPHVCNF